MDYYLDTTPLVNPASNWTYVAPYQPKGQERKARGWGTEFATARDALVDFFSPASGLNAPTPASSGQEVASALPTPTLSESAAAPAAGRVVAPQSVDVDRIAKQRMQLMAAKYAGGSEYAEVVARLEILNRRLLARAPRVSQEQVESLEKANDQLAQIRAAREERSRRFGISAVL